MVGERGWLGMGLIEMEGREKEEMVKVEEWMAGRNRTAKIEWVHVNKMQKAGKVKRERDLL